MNLIVGVVLIIAVIIGVISFFVGLYNKLVMLKFNVDKSFANINVLLKQRADEIPNLIKVVKEYQLYEKGTLERLTELRTQYFGESSSDKKIAIQNEISSSLSKIMVISENYPDLKANNSFTQLQGRVSTLEDHISDRREFFNESVNMYNIGITEFPAVILASIFGYKQRSLLQVSKEEKAYDGIKF